MGTEAMVTAKISVDSHVQQQHDTAILGTKALDNALD